MQTRFLTLTILLAAAPVAAQSGWTVKSGDVSGITENRTAVVTEPGAWKKLWAQHTRGMEKAPSLPQVDFKKEVVVAAFLGQRRTGGHRIEVEARPTANLSELWVAFHEVKPIKPKMVITMMTRPFVFKKLPRVYPKVRIVTLDQLHRIMEDVKTWHREDAKKRFEWAFERLDSLRERINNSTLFFD